MEINFEEMQVYDFSNLDLQEEGNDNCYSCDSDTCERMRDYDNEKT